MNICVSAIGASLDAEVGKHFAWNSDFSDRRYWNLGVRCFGEFPRNGHRRGGSVVRLMDAYEVGLQGDLMKEVRITD